MERYCKYISGPDGLKQIKGFKDEALSVVGVDTTLRNLIFNIV